MALLERVSTLVRANVNELLERAEDPEKLAKQLVLDMENQLIQVKTQVAIALADEHLLRRKQAEQETAYGQWVKKAELAVAKGEEEMARAALERALGCQRMAQGLAQQVTDQATEAETLRGAYARLEGKLRETKSRVELLMTQWKRQRALARAGADKAALESGRSQGRLDRLTAKVDAMGAENQVARTLVAVASGETLEDRFASLEQGEQIEALLLELKERQPRLG